VYENAAAALKISGCAHGQVEEKTYHALREVGLAAKAELHVAALSSSERRLISLARVLARLAHLVIADLNTCEIDQQTIAPRLEALAKYGCGVVILSKQRSHTDTAVGKAAELELR
jgi:ABC-type ATPase involved in cell division